MIPLLVNLSSECNLNFEYNRKYKATIQLNKLTRKYIKNEDAV